MLWNLSNSLHWKGQRRPRSSMVLHNVSSAKILQCSEGDQAEVTIWVESGPDKGDVLLHRESQRIDHEPAKDGHVLPMVERVKRFNLRYLNSQTNEWQEEWDSTGVDTANTLPRAVKFFLRSRSKILTDICTTKPTSRHHHAGARSSLTEAFFRVMVPMIKGGMIHDMEKGPEEVALGFYW